MAHIFFIGGTGHIGGEVLAAITSARPDIIITALVRDDEKGQRLAGRFSSVTPLVGTLHDIETLEKAAKDAGIVINTAPDIGNDIGIAAVLRGLGTLSPKGYYLHTAGAALTWDEPKGIPTKRIWDDIKDIDEILSLPLNLPHRVTDKMVLDSSANTNVAIISPTGVSGLSFSTEHPTPLTIPEIVKAVRYLNSGFIIGTGENLHSYVDVKDLAEIYVALLNDALKGPEFRSELWGPQAYYFGAVEEASFLQYMQALVPILKKKGLLTSEVIKQAEIDEVAKAVGGGELTVWSTHVAIMFGVNMRCRSSRAEKFLGWKPKGRGLREGFKEVIDVFLPRGKH